MTQSIATTTHNPVQITAENSTTGDPEVINSTGNATHIYGLAKGFTVVTAATYNTNEILGYRVLVQGSGDWTETPINGGGAATIPVAAQIVGNVNGEHLSAITVGTGGSALVYHV